MIMLDEWDKEKKNLAPIEPVVKRAGSTSISFAHSTFGRSLAGATPGMVHWGITKGASLFKMAGWWANLNLSFIAQ